MQQSAQAYVPHKDMQTEVADDIRTNFNAPNRGTADAYPARTVLEYVKSASHLSAWMAANLPEGLMVFCFPGVFEDCCARQTAWKDFIEKCVADARVVSIFPNQASCLRLVSAVLREISEEWLTGRTYITFESEVLSLSKGST